MATTKKDASPKADKLKEIREQSLENQRTGKLHGKQHTANQKRIAELKGDVKNQLKSPMNKK